MTRGRVVIVLCALLALAAWAGLSLPSPPA